MPSMAGVVPATAGSYDGAIAAALTGTIRSDGGRMNGFRRVIAGGCAAALLTVGTIGLALTQEAWLPCGDEPTGESCLRAMDQPTHLGALQSLWLLAVALCVVALVVSLRGMPRRLAASALVLVVVMNYLTEYLLWLDLAGGHWDVPPGTGYTQAAAFGVAGALIGVGALWRRRVGVAKVDARSAEPVPVA